MTDPEKFKDFANDQGINQKPLIQLPGNDRPIPDFARDLGRILATHGFYNRAGVCSTVSRLGACEELVVVQAQVFRTALEDYCTPFAKLRTPRGELANFNKTISLDHIAATVVCPQFLRSLPELQAFSLAQLPVRRAGGQIELLGPGYDKASSILTSKIALSYDRNISAKQAVTFLKNLLSEVCFHPDDKERGAAVVLAQMLTLYCEHLLPKGALRPGFLFSANAEGAGKTTLGHLAVITHLGVPSLTSMPEDNQELDKKICAAALAGKTVMFLDNTKGHLDCGALEAYMTSPTIEGRILGASRYFSVPNLLTFIFTGNGATVSPDLRRRLAIVELFMPEAKAEEHRFTQSLSIEDIVEKRPQTLSALWALVRDWSSASSPPPTKSQLFGYHQWAQIVLGILEHHGWTQFKSMPAKLEYSGDRQTLNMQQLLSVMAPQDPYTFEQIVNDARNNDLFDWIIGGQNTLLQPDARSKFGKLLKRYDKRIFAILEHDKTFSFRFEISQESTNNSSRRFSKIPVLV
jgi:hypothetical protein